MSRVAILVLGLCVYCAHAQTLRGRVQDPSGAAIANATVTIETETGTRNLRTDASGTFAIDVTYPLRLLVTAPGFNEVSIDLATGPLLEPVVLRPLAREQIVVTPARGTTTLLDNASSTSLLTGEHLQSSGAVTVDQKLRLVPGFTLFRRSGSFTANPTAQGASLRGIGASGASRALVLHDGVPLNDPFGGWVQWTRVPAVSLGGAEVVRGGASHLYGSDALSGVVNLLPSAPGNTLILDASYGAYHTPDLSVLASGEAEGWRATVTGEVLDTNGYIQVASEDKGSVDTPAGVRFGTARLRMDRKFGSDTVLALSTAFFNETRANGTALQTNSTRIGDGSASLSTVLDSNLLRFQLHGGAQRYAQSFSAISPGRNSETLTRTQLVPAQQLGGSAQWSRIIARHSLTAGLDLRDVRGVSNELIFVGGAPTTTVSAGGIQRSTGVYGQDSIRLSSRWLTTIGGRIDVWHNREASSLSAPVANPAALVTTRFADRTDTAFSPHLGVVYQPATNVALHASYYGSFRAPTLNELYRAFRVGNVLTLANAELKPERLYGGEFGGRYIAGDTHFSAVFFWSEVKDPVANRTLSVTPAIITRRRDNLGQTRSRGIEFEARHHFSSRIFTYAAYQFVDPQVISFPVDRSLEGLRIVQIPRQHFFFGATYSGPRRWTISFQGRFIGQQFEDDQNLLPLASFFSADAFIARRIGNRLQVYAAGENIFDQRYQIGRTPVITLGPPILARAGVRITLGKQ
jgi:outer membrane receptor protein involved in Fe transport